MKLLQESLSSPTGAAESSASSSDLIEPSQLKSKLVDSGLSSRIYSLLSNVDRVRADFLNRRREDINILICFLGNLCSLSALDLNSLKQNLEKFIVRIFKSNLKLNNF